jgi:hypothetical protein
VSRYLLYRTPIMDESERYGSNFEAWGLHDAVFHRLVVEWEAMTCRIEIEAPLVPAEKWVPCHIEWSGLRRVGLDRATPWGDAVQINRHWQGGESLWVIEMQTGAAIYVEAESVALRVARAV